MRLTGVHNVLNCSNVARSKTLQGNAQASFSIALTPTSLAFGAIGLNTSSAVENITVSNTGTLSPSAAGSVGSSAGID